MVKEYKSPWSAALWSLVLPGFGQLYNNQYLLGFILIFAEVSINSLASLNLSLLYTFHWDLELAHDVVNYQWGLFYPSVWGFSMWQGFNKAKTINHYLMQQGIVPPAKKSHLFGLFIGFVVGMDGGLLLYYVFKSPVLSCVSMGVVGAIVGHLIEKALTKKMSC